MIEKEKEEREKYNVLIDGAASLVVGFVSSIHSLLSLVCFTKILINTNPLCSIVFEQMG